MLSYSPVVSQLNQQCSIGQCGHKRLECKIVFRSMDVVIGNFNGI